MEISILGVYNQLGYGVVCGNVTAALDRQGDKVYLHSIDGPVHNMEGLKQSLIKAANQGETYNKNAPCLKIWHAGHAKQMVGNGPKILYPFFELDTFTKSELHQLKQLDKLIVASEWAKSVVESHKIDLPVKVINCGVDRSIFHERVSGEIPEIFKTKATKFLNVGKWEIRKGHDILIKIFERAFRKDDNVMLVMNCLNPHLNQADNEEWVKLYQSSPLRDKIQIIPRAETQSQLAGLMRCMDAGIFPARAEGWNLNALEMLSCGKHVIISDCTAHKEYCHNSGCLTVQPEGLEDAYDGVWFNGQGRWHSFGEKEISKFAEHMRSIHELKQSGKLKINTEGVMKAEALPWSKTAAEIREFLS